jgi:hypothetical protein
VTKRLEERFGSLPNGIKPRFRILGKYQESLTEYEQVSANGTNSLLQKALVSRS